MLLVFTISYARIKASNVTVKKFSKNSIAKNLNAVACY